MTGQYHKTDQWTTQDGELYPSDKPYAIDQEHADKMAQEQIDGAGCAICFFIKLEGGSDRTVHYVTTAGYVEEHDIDSKGWAHISMYNPGSGYNPKNNVGPWTATAKQSPSEAVGGVGLPAGNHVSTFAVLTWQEEDEGDGGDGGSTKPLPGDPALPDTITSVVRVGDTFYSGTLTKQGGVG